MKVTVTAKDSFAHGPKTFVSGDPVEVSIYEARDLAKRGLTSEPEETQVPVDTKMAGEVENKMADAPENKSRKSKQSEA